MVVSFQFLNSMTLTCFAKKQVKNKIVQAQLSFIFAKKKSKSGHQSIGNKCYILLFLSETMTAERQSLDQQSPGSYTDNR
jgi:hypothetical protein